ACARAAPTRSTASAAATPDLNETRIVSPMSSVRSVAYVPGCSPARAHHLLQKNAPPPPFLRPGVGRSVQHHHRRAGAAIRWPARQARAIGVSGLDEVDPIARREPGERAVGVLDQPRTGVQVVEDIEKFARMEGAGVAAQAP